MLATHTSFSSDCHRLPTQTSLEKGQHDKSHIHEVLTSGHLERDLCTGQKQHDGSYYHPFFRTGIGVLGAYRPNDHIADHQHERPGDDYRSTTQYIQQKDGSQGQDDTDGLADCLVDEKLISETDLSVESWAVDVAGSSQKGTQMADWVQTHENCPPEVFMSAGFTDVPCSTHLVEKEQCHYHNCPLSVFADE